MGISGIGLPQLLIILAIVIVLFGTKRLRNVGGDVGAALKNFRSAVKDEKPETLEKNQDSEGVSGSAKTASRESQNQSD